MKYFKLITWLAVFFFSVNVFSCSDDDEELTMWIASEKVLSGDPVGGEVRPMIQYKLNESDIWMSLRENIAGFDYEEGYEYVILVKCTRIKNPLQDQSAEQYSLIKIISKTKVESPS